METGVDAGHPHTPQVLIGVTDQDRSRVIQEVFAGPAAPAAKRGFVQGGLATPDRNA